MCWAPCPELGDPAAGEQAGQGWGRLPPRSFSGRSGAQGTEISRNFRDPESLPSSVCQPPNPKMDSEKMGALGGPDPSLARARGWVGGDVGLRAPPSRLLTPLPSPPGEGPSHPRVSRFQLIQDFSVNYNRVWTPALPLPPPLAPSPKCETLPKATESGQRALWSAPASGASAGGPRGSPSPPWWLSQMQSQLFLYIYIRIYIEL